MKIKRISNLVLLDKFIQKCDKGFETVVGERGLKLSGGQNKELELPEHFIKQTKDY